MRILEIAPFCKNNFGVFYTTNTSVSIQSLKTSHPTWDAEKGEAKHI
jgi:hypothetical protein